MTLPDIEAVSARVHEAWMAGQRAKGFGSHFRENGEEMMVPYAQLSESAKDLDRGTVRTVYAAIEAVATSVRRVEDDMLWQWNTSAAVRSAMSSWRK